MKVNIITDNECFNMDSETGNVVRNMNVKWNLANRIFYIEQDGALKLPNDNDYVIDFDPNEVKAGDFIFVSYRIDGKMHVILLKDKGLTDLMNLFKKDREKHRLEEKCENCCADCGPCANCDDLKEA
nr:MAG TPA: hypothetical protein [Caudoviricetes sp.]